MSLGAELKRRLESDTKPLNKRLKLAENVIAYPYFPDINREEIIIRWLSSNLENDSLVDHHKNVLTSLKECVKSLNFKILSATSREELFSILSKLLSDLRDDMDITNSVLDCCLCVIENPTANAYFQQSALEYFTIFSKIFEKLTNHIDRDINVDKIESILQNVYLFTKSSNKKSVLANAFMESGLPVVLLKFSTDDRFTSKIFNIFQLTVLQSASSALFKIYSLTLIKGESPLRLFEEKGEVLKPIVTIMDMFMKCDNLSFSKNEMRIFLRFFIKAYKFDAQLIFLLNIILYKCLGIDQTYINVCKKIQKLELSDEFVMKMHLENLKYLSEFEIDMKTNMDMIKKYDADVNFMKYMQHMTDLIVNRNSLNSISLQIIKRTFLLDPETLDDMLESLLPDVLIQKKSNMDEYDDMLGEVLETAYKMSRELNFIIKLLVSLKTKLKSIDKKLIKSKDNNSEEYLMSTDIFSDKFCDSFGKLGSELTSRQYIDLFKQLIDYLNEFCLNELQNNVSSPSTILLTELLSSVISALCIHSKIADQNVPEIVYKKFDSLFKIYNEKVLHNFGVSMINFPNESRLHRAFLNISKSYGHLKLLLWQFQPHFDSNNQNSVRNKLHVSDITDLHSYLPNNLWKSFYKLINKSNDELCISMMNELILQNSIVEIYLKNSEVSEKSLWNDCVKDHIMNNFESFWPLIRNNELYFNLIFSNVSQNEMNVLCNKFIFDNSDILDENLICKNKNVLLSIATVCIKNIWLNYNSDHSLEKYTPLYDSSDLDDFDIKSVLKNVSDRLKYMDDLIKCDILSKKEVRNEFDNIFKILNTIPLYNLKESIQYSVLFFVLVVQLHLIKFESIHKRLKSIKSNCTSIMMKLFDLSFKSINLFEVLPPKYFIQLIESGFFGIISPFDVKYDTYRLLRQILLGILVKDNLPNLEYLMTRLLKALKSVSKSKKYAEAALDYNFQTSCLYFNILSSIKRANLPLDSKTNVLDFLTDATPHIIDYFENVDWKNMKEKFSNNLEHVDVNEKCAYLNLIDTYSFIILNNMNMIGNKIDGALNFFMELSLQESFNNELNIHHAKACCLFIGTILKNHDSFKTSMTINEETFVSKIWHSSKRLLSLIRSKIGTEWSDTNNLILENIRLIYEVCSIKIFNGFVMKELTRSSERIIENSSDKSVLSENAYVIKSFWSCFLNANLKAVGKTEARSAAVKKMVKKFSMWLNNMSENLYSNRIDEEQSENDKTIVIDKETLFNRNMEIINICLEVIIRFVATKKIILSNNLIDSIIQMPYIINFDLKTNKNMNKIEHFDTFCVLYERSLSLLSNLLLFRSELLQDRLPAFLLSYRILINNLCIKSNSDNPLNGTNLDRLIKLGLSLEKFTEIIVKHEKQDLSRIASYILTDIIVSFQKVSIYPSVKFHLQNCVYSLMQLLDSHATAFLMRNMPDTTRVMFQTLYENYKKYYKYVGTS